MLYAKYTCGKWERGKTFATWMQCLFLSKLQLHHLMCLKWSISTTTRYHTCSMFNFCQCEPLSWLASSSSMHLFVHTKISHWTHAKALNNNIGINIMTYFYFTIYFLTTVEQLTPVEGTSPVVQWFSSFWADPFLSSTQSSEVLSSFRGNISEQLKYYSSHWSKSKDIPIASALCHASMYCSKITRGPGTLMLCLVTCQIGTN